MFLSYLLEPFFGMLDSSSNANVFFENEYYNGNTKIFMTEKNVRNTYASRD